VGANLLQALQILAKLGVDRVGENLVVLAVHNVALPIEEPAGDLVLGRVLDDGDNALELFRREFAGAECVLVLIMRRKRSNKSLRRISLDKDCQSDSGGAF